MVCSVALLVSSIERSSAQFYSVSTNGLLWLTGTINGSFGVSLSKKWSLDITAAYNPIVTEALQTNFAMLQQGVRRWSFESGVGFFWGIHLTQAIYDVGNRDFHYKGLTAGLGASVGYSLLLSRRWNMCFELGGSALYMVDRRMQHHVPDNQHEYIYNYNRVAIAPTKAEVSIVYIF